MNIEESKNQIETLIEAWQLDEADLNQTDINAMQVLLKENQELKKQLENAGKVVGTFFKGMITLEIQQKEFINYINTYIALLNDKPDLLKESQKDILQEILQKYKEIIGDDR